MKIIGCDLHTRYQQIAMLDQETGELIERRLEHASGEAHAFYAALSGPVRVGIEATGHTRWFERRLEELGHELWIGDAALSEPTRLSHQPFSLPTLTSKGATLEWGTRSAVAKGWGRKYKHKVPRLRSG
jgi:hypothetical protein